jgi:hypothetical protein
MYRNLFCINPISHHINNTQAKSNNKKTKTTSNDLRLRHLRLGRINPNCIQRLIQDGPLDSLRLEEWPQCKSCLLGKMNKRCFTQKIEEPRKYLP